MVLGVHGVDAENNVKKIGKYQAMDLDVDKNFDGIDYVVVIPPSHGNEAYSSLDT